MHRPSMSPIANETAERPSSLKPLLEHPSPPSEPDWRNIGIFAAGLAVGVALGATAALLTQTHNRSALRMGLPRSDGEADAVWDELAAELDRAAADLKRADGE